MKKYLAAGAVAIMVFAFAAMAASLEVDGGTLQTGVDHDLTCMDEANVDAWVYRDSPLPVEVESVTIQTVGATSDCDGQAMHLILLNADGSELARGNAVNNPDAVFAKLGGSDATYQFDFSGVHPRDVEGIRIGVDQGY